MGMEIREELGDYGEKSSLKTIWQHISTDLNKYSVSTLSVPGTMTATGDASKRDKNSYPHGGFSLAEKTDV